MIFIEWWIVERIAILLVVLAVSCAAMWLMRNRRTWLRVVIAIFASPFALLASLFLFLQWTAIGCLSYSPAVYPPDHRKAARVRTDDAGAIGGNSHVELFAKHGFFSTDVYSGQWRSVDANDIRWISDTQLEVTHEGRCIGVRTPSA